MTQKLRAFEEKNKQEILKNQSRQAENERLIASQIADENNMIEARKRNFQIEEWQIEKTTRKVRQEVMEIALGVCCFHKPAPFSCNDSAGERRALYPCFGRRLGRSKT